MRERINDNLRDLVITRAEHLCEYCLIHEEDTYLGCEVDHIISVKHGGSTTADNLAYACFFCNRYKGSDVGSIIGKTNYYVRFFNPRVDRWAEHFQLDGLEIHPLNDVGEATARILRFNDVERLLERQDLIRQARYPTMAALRRMNP